MMSKVLIFLSKYFFILVLVSSVVLPTTFFKLMFSSEDQYKPDFFYYIDVENHKFNKKELEDKGFITNENVKDFVKDFVIKINTYKRTGLDEYRNKAEKMFTEKGFSVFWPKFVAKFNNQVENNMFLVEFSGQKVDPVLLSKKTFSDVTVWNYIYEGLVVTRGLSQNNVIVEPKRFFVRVITMDVATNPRGVGVDSYYIR